MSAVTEPGRERGMDIMFPLLCVHSDGGFFCDRMEEIAGRFSSYEHYGFFFHYVVYFML